jgi:SAM-dependent methyltransferase
MEIDKGAHPIDWGKTSSDYAKHRDIYPKSFYEKIRSFGIGLPGQRILDLATGTGVLPRGLSRPGIKFIGTDISEGQIREAERLSREQELDIEWKACPAENTGFPDRYFDAITACQCWWYFDLNKIIPEILRMLIAGGKLLLAFMNWLPAEDPVAAKTEELVVRYNPEWQGNNFPRHVLEQPAWSKDHFCPAAMETYDERILFTRETWQGRIRACRGIGAALPEEEVRHFDEEHKNLLDQIVPEEFSILHQIWFYVLTPK